MNNAKIERSYMENKSFEFHTVPLIRVEWGGAGRLAELLAEKFAQRNILIVTDPGLVKAGLIEPIVSNLRANGYSVAIFDAVVADPPEDVVLAAVEYGRQVKPGVILGLGGGSSLDVAKLLAVLLASEQKITDIYGIGKVQGTRLPLVQIPTTAGTGSEVTNISIITTGAATKLGVVAPQLYADLVLLDAQLTLGLPRIATAATGIDAMVHAIEAYTSKIKKNPISDTLAREALRIIAANLLTACQDGQNRAAREGLLLGATLAGQAFANSPVAAVHALAYPLGSHYHVAHGLSNALMLGPVLRFNTSAAAHQYAELADVIGVPGYGNTEERADAFIQAIEILMSESGSPRRLRDVGVTEDSLGMLADEAMKQTRLLINNPIALQRNDAMALYREAY
ncbi:MAG: iron-containing alcohol dehydrogenase [Giesbergeria sp.]|jgi:alcohol dehydrogenase class IV